MEIPARCPQVTASKGYPRACSLTPRPFRILGTLAGGFWALAPHSVAGPMTAVLRLGAVSKEDSPPGPPDGRNQFHKSPGGFLGPWRFEKHSMRQVGRSGWEAPRPPLTLGKASGHTVGEPWLSRACTVRSGAAWGAQATVCSTRVSGEAPP